VLGKSRVSNVFHYVSDLDRTEAFYRDVLGLAVERIDDGDHGAFLVAKTGGGLDLLFFVGEVKAGNTPILVFDFAEPAIEEVVEELARQGAPIVTPLSPAPGGLSADFQDPEGHVLSLYQSRE